MNRLTRIVGTILFAFGLLATAGKAYAFFGIQDTNPTPRIQVNPTDSVTVDYVTLVGPRTYYIVQGDTLWDLNPDQWRQIQAANPKLNAESRIGTTSSGLYRVLLIDNEPIEIPTGLTIRIRTSAPVTFVPPPSPSKAELKKIEVAETPKDLPSQAFLWLLLVFGVFAVVVTLLSWLANRAIQQSKRRKTEERDRELRRDPVTSGPPMVAGGVASTDTARIARTMEAAAINDYIRLNPGVDRQTVRVERIGPVEEGMISGSGMVGYADHARPRSIDPPQPGFRARFRFPDNREDMLMSLQGCMNPCYYGEGLSGFTFTARQMVVAAPEPERPAPQAAPHPAMAVRAIRAAAQAEGHSTVTIGDRVLTFERGVHFTVDEQTGAIGMSGNSFGMTIQPKRQRAKATRQESKTGTQ
jgi:hypothetical protein